MNAVISGRAAVALMIDGERVHSIHYDAPDEQVARSVEEWNLLLGGVDDLEFFEDCDEASVRDHLEDAVDCTEALDLVLYLFDGGLSDDARRTASLELDELLAYPEIEAYLESILYARPLVESADRDSAPRCCDPDARNTQRVIDALLDHQQAITLVRHAFDYACEELPARENRQQAESACLHAGVFARFAKAGDDSNAIGSVWMAALQDPTLKQRLSGEVSKKTLTSWANSLRELWGQDSPQPKEKQAVRAPNRHRREEHRRGGKRKGRQSFDREQAKINVDKQKDRIVELLARHKFAQARRIIDEVVAYNIEFGGAEFACKTLCSLAKSAQDLGLASLQLELTERSIALAPDDGWSWAQHGKALLDSGRPTDALLAYDRALEMTSDVEAKTGRAEVLKAQGKLPEALSAYEQVIREHPENVVARNARAEVLKSQGKLPEALAAYEEVTHGHPENVVARSGRAEVLKSLGKLREALFAYEQVIQEYPEDVVARSGRAEVLKSLGELPEALFAYEQVIQEYPEDVVARNGRAEVLKAQGELDKALAAYEQVIQEHPEDVFARTGRAEVIKAQGELDKALAAYEQVIHEHPENVVARNGRAEVLKALGQLPEALSAYEQVIQEHPEDVVAKSGRACVLAELGRWDDALSDLPTLSEGYRQDWIGLHIRAMILLKTGQLPAARQIFEVGLDECPFAAQLDYFRAGLCFADMAESRYAAAAERWAEVREPALQRPAILLRVHALGADEKYADAVQVYRTAPEPVSELEREIKTELTFRYVDRSGEQHDDAWLLEREVRWLLAA